MRLDTAREETITNLSGSRKFQMNASAKAFQILSSGIYERKIEAIVRELCCNAYDSHIEAGKGDVPFRVQLPTLMNDSIFAVEDFGVGLSELQVAGGFIHKSDGTEVPWSVAEPFVKSWEEEVEKALELGRETPEHPYLSVGYDEVGGVYTTYFESTKTDSNEVIGALGLGSKSPFSYTDSFTIKARKGGVECVFSAQISATGEPEVIKMYDRPWTGSNGVEVSVEVASKDVREFKSCASKVLSWFAVKPDLNIDISFDISEEIVNNVREFGYHLQTNDNRWGRSLESKVLMGNVSYDLDVNSLRTSDSSDDGFDKFITQLYSMKADVYFSIGIGDADVAANRETLSLDDRTKENLRSKLKMIRTNFKKNTLEKMGRMSNIFEARDSLTDYEKSFVMDYRINGYCLKDIPGTFNSYFIAKEDDNGNIPAGEAALEATSDKYDIAFFGSFNKRYGSKPRSKRDTSCRSFSLIRDNVITVVINDCERKVGLKDALGDALGLPEYVLVVSDKKTTLTKELETLIKRLTLNCYKIVYTSSFWDGKLSTNRSTSTGLAKDVIKGKFVRKGDNCVHFSKVDFSVEDGSKWAYAEQDGYFAVIEGVPFEFQSGSDLNILANELDLDGIMLYHCNNKNKVKKNVTHNLSELVKQKATLVGAKKAIVGKAIFKYRGDPISILKGFKDLVEFADNRSDFYPKCSAIMSGTELLGSDTASGVKSSVVDRLEVMKESIKILREQSPVLKNMLTWNFYDASMESEVVEYIEFVKNKGK